MWDLLVSLGSDVNVEDDFGKTPLYFLTNESEVQLPDKVRNTHKPYKSEGRLLRGKSLVNFSRMF